jgi:energy coupling factor transporter S component ThiW
MTTVKRQNGSGLDLRRLVLAAMFAAMATVLGSIPALGSIPVGPLRIAPFQHTINALAGVLIGPWYAAGAALVAAILRYNLHTGSIFAFPGSPFGALVVGYMYRWTRSDFAALADPLGTGPIGATLAALVFQPFIGSHHTIWWFQVAFLSSSIPGAILGFVVLRALRPALGHVRVNARA